MEDTASPRSRSVRMAVFVLDGNRLVHPIYAYEVDPPDNVPEDHRSYSTVAIEAMMFGVTTGLQRPEREKAWATFPLDDEGTITLAHVKVELSSSAFAHGRCTMMCIAGPKFDEVMADATDPT